MGGSEEIIQHINCTVNSPSLPKEIKKGKKKKGKFRKKESSFFFLF